MAVEFVTDTKRTDTLYRVWPHDLEIDPELNGRHDHTSVEELAADIAANGQDTPVVIRKDDEGRPMLVAGHRRYRAICLLNERNPEMPRAIIARCMSKGASEADAFRATIRENRFRKDVSPIDDATNIGILKTRFGLSVEDIAKIYFPEGNPDGTKWVEQRESLLSLAPEAAQAVRDGKVKSITAAVALSKLTKTQQRKKLEGKGPVTAASVKPPKAKKIKIDSKLHSLITNVVSSADFDNFDENTMVNIEVNAVCLVSLKNFINEN